MDPTHRPAMPLRRHSPETVDCGDALHGCQVDWGAACDAKESLTRPTENKQPSGLSVTNDADGHRESRAQPTPAGETPGANGPDAQPGDVSGLGMASKAPREDTRYRGQADSPVTHHNFRDQT